MDFAALPPEVNSGLMYTGPGSAPMMAAAASWDNLAVEMYSAASDYGSVIANLTTGPWRGTASTSMAAAAAPYASWMSTTAAQAEQAAGQAKAAASAYESAFTSTVPPPVIVANRALLASLISTNLLGQNTPAIAATEAHYAEMWAQDAAAMYGYAGASSAASTLTPFTDPPATTTTTGAAAQAATVAQATGTGTQSTLSQLVTAMPAALQGLASPATSSGSGAESGFMNMLDFLTGNGSGTGLSAVFNDLFSSNGLGLNANFWNTIFSSGLLHAGQLVGHHDGSRRASERRRRRRGGGCGRRCRRGRDRGGGRRPGWCIGGPGRRNRRAGQCWWRGFGDLRSGCGDRSAGRAAELGCDRADDKPDCRVVGGRPDQCSSGGGARNAGDAGCQCGRILLQRQRSQVRFPPDGNSAVTGCRITGSPTTGWCTRR